MNRREFISRSAAPPSPGRWPRARKSRGRSSSTGILEPGPRRLATNDAFIDGMRRYGFIEGQNLLDDPNGYELRTEQFAGHASEIVKQGVDLIVCAGDDAVRAAQQATEIIPILAGTDDMLGAGFVHSMAKPKGI